MRDSTVLRLLRFSQRHSTAVIIAAFLVTLALGWFALDIQVDADVLSLVPEDEQVNRLIEQYGQGKVTPDWLVIAVESEDPYRADRLAAFARAVERIEALPETRSGVHPFSLYTFEADGRRIEIVPIAPGNRAPSTPEEVQSFRLRLTGDALARKFVVSEDGRMLAAFFPMERVQEAGPVMDALHEILADLKPHFRTYVSGPLPFEHVARKYLIRDLPRLLMLAAVLILLVYYAGFQSLRAVVLPFLVVAFGTVWTIGLMSLLGYTLSLIGIMIPPLVLTLGSSYSIHVLNQYYREAKTTPSGASAGSPSVVEPQAWHLAKSNWIAHSVVHVNKTIMLAALTTVIGFGSLLATSLRQTREFGLATSLGIMACAILSLIFLPAVLSRLNPPSARQQRKVLEGPIARLMERLSRFVLRNRVAILLFMVLIGVVFGFVFNSVEHQSDYMSYFPEGEPAVQDTEHITRRLGSFSPIYLTLCAPEGRKNYFLDPEVLRSVARLEDRLSSDPDVFYTLSFVSYVRELNRLTSGSREVPEARGLILLLSRYFKTISRQSSDGNMVSLLANEDFSQLTVIVRAYDPQSGRILFEAGLRRLLTRMEGHIAATLGPEIETELWGTSFILLSLADILNRNLLISMLISVALILLVTSLSFRDLCYGLFTLIPLMTGIMLNFIFMAVTRVPLDMTTAMFSSVAIGVGVDNSIHFIIQFRRQVGIFPDNLEKVLSRSMKATGRPILLTSASVVAGLLVLTAASFLPIRYFGLLVALALLTTAVGSLVILPAILSLSYGREVRRARRNGELHPASSEWAPVREKRAGEG